MMYGVLSSSCASACLTRASKTDPWKRCELKAVGHRAVGSDLFVSKKSMWLRGTRKSGDTRVAGCPQSRKHGWCPSSACNDMMHQYQYADAFFARPCWSWILFTERCNQCIFNSYLILCGPSCFWFLNEYYTCLQSEDMFVKMGLLGFWLAPQGSRTSPWSGWKKTFSGWWNLLKRKIKEASIETSNSKGLDSERLDMCVHMIRIIVIIV